jgi:hypothetical protein
MRWFRLNTRPTTWLAFFALALQFALAFGHLHASEWRRIAADSKHAVITSLKLGSSDTPAGPAQQDTDGFCAICASIRLVGSLVLPPPPAQALPPAIDRVWVPRALASIASTAGRLSFQARAPPAAHHGDALENCRAAA